MSTTRSFAWGSGGGNITVTYDGTGNGTITITSDENTATSDRSKTLAIRTLNGSVVKTFTINQAAAPVIDLTGAIITIPVQTYSGSALTPTPTLVTLEDGTTVVPSEGYTITGYTNNTNAGTGTITIEGTGDYVGTVTGEFTIQKADPVYVIPAANNHTYTGSSDYLISAGSTSHGTIQYSSDNSTWSTTRPEETDANTYTIYWRLVGDSNHNDIASTSISITISKANPTYTAPIASSSLVYTGNAQYLTTTGSTSHGTIQYSGDGNNWSTTRITGTNANTYTTYWKLVGDSNHNDVSSTSISTTISQASGVAGITTVSGLTYNRGPQNLVSVSGNTGTVHYRIGTSGEFSTTIPSSTNAGSYTIYYYADASSDGNYASIGSSSSPSSISSSIAKMTPTADISPAKVSDFTYDGNAHDLLTGGYVVHSESVYVPIVGTFTYPQGTNAGTYSSLTWSWAPADTTNYNSISGTVSGSVIISKADPTYTAPTAKTGLVYTGSAQYLLNAGSTDDGTIEYSSDGSTWSSTALPQQTNANTTGYTVYWKLTGNSNYNSVSSTSITVTIAKAQAEVITLPTGNSNLTYNGSSQELLVHSTASTNTGAIQFRSKLSSDSSYGSWSTYPKATNAGTYNVQCRAIGDENNYIWSEPSEAVNVTIAQKALSITAKAQTITYGGSISTGTGQVTTSGLVSGDSLTGITLWANTTNVPGGTITPSAAFTTNGIGNYNVTYNTGTLTINKANPTYTAPSAKTLTYSGSSQELVNAGSSSHGTFTYSTSQNGTYSATIPSGTGANTYTVWWKFTGDSNHNNVSATQVTGVSIGAKALSITAKAQTIIYGESIATGTSQVTTSGLVSGDSLTAITLTASTSSATTSGNITPSGATTSNGVGNYSVTYFAGNLTINKANPTYTAPTAKTGLVYSGSAQDLLNAGSSPHGLVEYSSDGNTWSSTTIPQQTNANTSGYTVYWRLTGDSDHNNVSSTSITVTIAKANPTYTAPSAAVPTYSGTAQNLISAGSSSHGSFTYSSSQNGTYSATIPQGTDATNYTVYWKLTGDSNHNSVGATQVTGVSIAKKALSITAKAQTITYGGSIATGTGQVTTSGLVSGDSLTAISLAASTTNVPGGTITPSAASTTKGASNYNITYNTGTLTINKANPTYTAPTANTLTYTGSAQYLTTTGSTSHGTIYYSSDGTNWYTTRRTGTNANTYTTYWKLTGDGNHNDVSSTSISTTINQANGVAGVSSRALTYSRTAQNLVTVSGNTGTVHYKLNSGSWSTTIPTATNASNSYVIYYYVDASSNGNYKAVGSSSSPSSVTSSIAKVTPVLSTSPSLRTGLVYSGSAQNLLSGGAMKFSSSDSTSVSGTFTYTQQTNAGTYSNPTWTFTPSSTTNYNSTSGSITGNVTIAQATGYVTTAPTNRNVDYTGSNQYIVTAGSGSGTMYYRAKLSTSSTWSSWSTTRPYYSAAGTYNVEYYCAASSDGNYTASATGSLNATINVVKQSRTLSFSSPAYVVAPSGTMTKVPTPSAGSGDGTITYTISSTSHASINSSSGLVTAGSVEGSATVTATISEGTNYLSASASYTLYVFSTIHNFNYTGAVQSITLPPGTFTLETWGAQGGANAANSTYSITSKTGGKGGYSVGQLTIDTEKTVYAFVGGQGSSSGNGGWNGGGGGGGSSSYNSSNTYGLTRYGCGGGATDIALVNSTMTYSSYRTNRTSESLLSRIIVAGGGSGAAMCYKGVTTTTTEYETDYSVSGTLLTITTYNSDSYSSNVLTIRATSTYSSGLATITDTHPETSSSTTTSNDSSNGYVGGGTTGGAYSSSYYGTQTAAGSNGGFGYGANQTSTNYRYVSACGGGGWYGGGGGQSSDSQMSYCRYMGGGSGFVNIAANSASRPNGYTGIELNSGSTYDGTSTFKSPSGSNETGHSGNGYARITYLDPNTPLEFEYTGNVVTQTLSAGRYKIEAWGAQGGSYSSTYAGGKGGYSVGELTLTSQTNLYIRVGGQGTGGTSSGAKAGGFNGGGKGYSTSTTYIECGGGGASDVRIGQDSLYARVLVAGGGGGAGSYSSSYRYSGGYGGGATGGTPSQYSTSYKAGTGGTQTAKGTSYYGTTANSTTYGTIAAFGVGAGASTSTSYQISGGGGGWYGGGYSRRGAGGGGSGYVYNSSTASNYPSGCLLNSAYYLANSNTYDGNTSNPSVSGSTETGHTGNGYIRITKL